MSEFVLQSITHIIDTEVKGSSIAASGRSIVTITHVEHCLTRKTNSERNQEGRKKELQLDQHRLLFFEEIHSSRSRMSEEKTKESFIDQSISNAASRSDGQSDERSNQIAADSSLCLI